MNQLKNILTLILLLAFANIGQSQNCYEIIADMSGFDTSPYQAELETTACELQSAFPAEFQNQFKVYDFGFYSQNEFMQGGFQAVWDKVVSEIPTDYYLIFGKQTDRTGIYTKFWFDIKLPDEWLNQCFDEAYIQMLKTSIIFNLGQIEYSKNPYTYAEFEKECMNYLKGKIQELNDCCQPNLKSGNLCDGCITSSDVNGFFKTNGFDSINIEIINPDTTIIEECLCQSESVTALNKENTKSRRSGSFIDYTHGYMLELNGTELSLSKKGNEILGIYNESYGIITHSLNYCQEDFYSLWASFNNSSKAFWFHVTDSKLYFKSKGFGDNIIVGSCNAQHRDQLECILQRFESTGANIYTEILQAFDNSKKDIIVNVDCPPGDTTAQGQTIDELLGRLGIVEIYINPDQFEIIEDYPLKPAATLIHEMCHGLMSLNVLKANGPQNCTWLNYNYYYSAYGNVGETDECIMAKYFIDKQAKLLWLYNNKHMEQKHYLSSAWGPYFYPYAQCKSNVNYTQSDISDWYIEMRDSNPNPFPCMSN